jgi:outer membrane protein TolC
MKLVRPARLAALLALMATAAPAPRPASALDLDAVLNEVAAANPTLAARRAMVEAARRRVGPAGAWVSPMLELGAINVPTSGRFDMDPMTMKMAAVKQRVPVFGSNRLSRGAAREDVRAEGAATRMSGYELFGMAWEAYADAYYAGALAREAEEHQSVMDRLVQSARARYESGNGRLDDVLRAEAERARSLADLAAFRAEERSARARLDALRGIAPGGAAETLAPPPAPAVPEEAGAWLAAVSPSHPRLEEMDAQARRYRLAARAARRMAWPELELGGSYGRRGTLEGGVAQDDMFSATVGFMVPIFAGQREYSEGAELDAMARARESERRAMELDLQQEVIATHATASAAQRTVALLADTVVATERRAVDASWVSYSAGSTDLWRVFEASHSLYTELIALARARQDLARAESRLLSLTGRGDLLGLRVPAIRENER